MTSEPSSLEVVPVAKALPPEDLALLRAKEQEKFDALCRAKGERVPRYVDTLGCAARLLPARFPGHRETDIVAVSVKEMRDYEVLERFLGELADALNPAGYEIAIAVHATDPRKVAMSGFEDSGSQTVADRVFMLLSRLKEFRSMP